MQPFFMQLEYSYFAKASSILVDSLPELYSATDLLILYVNLFVNDSTRYSTIKQKSQKPLATWLRPPTMQALVVYKFILNSLFFIPH